MSGFRRAVAVVLLAALALALVAYPTTQAVAGPGDLLACGVGAQRGAKWLCKLGAWWCAGGLVGGCLVGIAAYRLGD